MLTRLQSGPARRLAPALLAGVLLLGGVGAALAGADDGGNKAFFGVASPGSASGMPTTTAPGTTNAAANAQPNASVARTGVAMERTARPHVAAVPVASERVAARTVPARATVARHEPARHRTLAAERRLPSRDTLHALHRAPGEGRTQS